MILFLLSVLFDFLLFSSFSVGHWLKFFVKMSPARALFSALNCIHQQFTQSSGMQQQRKFSRHLMWIHERFSACETTRITAAIKLACGANLTKRRASLNWGILFFITWTVRALHLFEFINSTLSYFCAYKIPGILTKFHIEQYRKTSGPKCHSLKINISYIRNICSIAYCRIHFEVNWIEGNHLTNNMEAIIDRFTPTYNVFIFI